MDKKILSKLFYSIFSIVIFFFCIKLTNENVLKKKIGFTEIYNEHPLTDVEKIVVQKISNDNENIITEDIFCTFLFKCKPEDTIQHNFLKNTYKNDNNLFNYLNFKLIAETQNQINNKPFLNLNKLKEIRDKIEIKELRNEEIYELLLKEKKISTIYAY